MARRPWRAFLDTSELIAGLLSPTGGAHEVLRLFEICVVELTVSRQVQVEADRNLTTKLPAFLDAYLDFLYRLSPTIVEDPGREAVGRAMNVIHHADEPTGATACPNSSGGRSDRGWRERRKSAPDRESTEPPRCESHGYLCAVESRFCAAGLKAQCVEHAGGGSTSSNSGYREERKDTVTLNDESNFPHRGTCN